MNGRISAAERAAVSGFSAKLRAWFDANHSEWKEGDPSPGPRSATDLARYLTHMGEPVNQTAVGKWERAEALPHARYIGLLEKLMGCAWAYLDDPKAEWPPDYSQPEHAKFLMSIFGPEVAQELIEELRAEKERGK